MKPLLVGLACSLLLGGCAWRDSGESSERSAAHRLVQRIVYTRYRPGGRSEVWVARVDGSGKRRLVQGHVPAISPDGRWVAFEARTGARVYPRDLMLISTSGGRPRLLMRAVGQAVWSPDSARLAVLQHFDDRSRALLTIAMRALLAGLANEFGLVPYAVDPRTGSVHAIGEFGYHAWPQGLSRDGRLVLVTDNGVEVTRWTRIEVVPYAGGRGSVIARRAGEASWNT